MSPWMLCAVLLSLRAPRASTLSCLHPNGSAVDWFIIYKAPAVKKSNEVFTDPLEEGQFFVWTFPGASSWIWDRKLSIAKGGDSALGTTLEQVFSRNESLVKIFYNDERPVGTKSSTGGHTKGILGFDSSSGFWIVHSAPKFPASTSEYVFPSSALRFGQSFMCLSLNSTEYLDEVSHQLLYDEPHIYFSSQPDWALKLPYFADLVHKKSRRIQTPYYRTFQFTSFTDGVPFISFAKSSKFHKDLYVDLVSLFLKTSLWVESWTNGSGGRLNSSCTGIAYPVINVGVVRLVDADFHHTEDHSKWAIGGGQNQAVMEQRGMVILSGNSHPDLAEDIARHLNIHLGHSSVYHNTNRETMVEVQESVRGKDVYIIQTGSRDVNNTIMELLIMCYACKTSSCNKVIGVIPYMPYSQQTKMRRRGNISLKLFAEMLVKAGFDHIITVDLHSKESQGFFDCVVDNLRASPFLIQYIMDSIPDYRNAVIVAKNPLAARRATSYADRLRLGIAVIHGEAKEDEDDLDGRASPPPTLRGRVLSVGATLPPLTAKEKPPINVVGDVGGKIAIMVDDMIDDVQSFVDASIVLKERGAYKIYALATHGVLSADAPRLIEESPIDEVVVTNTVPHDSKKLQCHKIKTVDISILMAEAIRRIHNKESMSHLFRHVTLED